MPIVIPKIRFGSCFRVCCCLQRPCFGGEAFFDFFFRPSPSRKKFHVEQQKKLPLFRTILIGDIEKLHEFFSEILTYCNIRLSPCN